MEKFVIGFAVVTDLALVLAEPFAVVGVGVVIPAAQVDAQAAALADGEMLVAGVGGDDVALAVENVTGTIEGSTAGGNVVATLNPAKNGRSRLSTAGGNIRLFIPEGAKATINARIRITGWWRSRKDTYEIRSDFPMDKYEKDEQGHEIRATILLNGGGEQVTLNAVSGSIEIRKGRP